MAKQIRQSNRSRILMRYGLISLGFVVLAILIVFHMFKTTVVKAEEWNKRAEQMLNELAPIAPERGDIMADNGNILACNLQVYDIKVDLRHAKIKALNKKLPWAKIDSLADSLDLYYPLRADLQGMVDKDSPDSWHHKFRSEFGKDPDKRKRALRIAKKASLEDFERIKAFPFFKDFKGSGTRNPVYTETKTVRIYPYGKMAHRSIGRVNEFEGEFHGYSGLEKDLDSLLYGKTGLAKKVMMTSGVGNWVHTPAQRGYDVHTTINIDMQDMLEEELTKVCEEAEAYWGTALLMEVATGEIKAVANVERMEDGSYGEALNRAVRGFEPGSVMKPISLMIAFEDGLVKSVNDRIDCSPFQKTSDPHAPTVKTMKQVIEMSSNTGISRVMFRGFAQEPEKFHERLRQIGFLSPMQSGIYGEEVPYFPSVAENDNFGNKQTRTARHLTLARQCYGYSATIPPLYTLAYYNAIANKGIMVKPHLVRRINNGTIDSVINIRDLELRVCSEENAAKVKECLKEPVWGSHGTARAVQDDRVMIAGKTGTAFPIPDTGGTYDKTKRRFAFAGFFPYENPKYSCIALILAPSGRSANRTSGQVVKNMAVKMYSRGMLDNVSTFTADRSASTPVMTNSDKKDGYKVASNLGATKVKAFQDKRDKSPRGTVPNLSGYDAASAIRILEQQGWEAKIEGVGYVVAQIPSAGSQLPRGKAIKLKLKQ